jgi:hypothetical protein
MKRTSQDNLLLLVAVLAPQDKPLVELLKYQVDHCESSLQDSIGQKELTLSVVDENEREQVAKEENWRNRCNFLSWYVPQLHGQIGEYENGSGDGYQNIFQKLGPVVKPVAKFRQGFVDCGDGVEEVSEEGFEGVAQEVDHVHGEDPDEGHHKNQQFGQSVEVVHFASYHWVGLQAS